MHTLKITAFFCYIFIKVYASDLINDDQSHDHSEQSNLKAEKKKHQKKLADQIFKFPTSRII